MVASKEVRSFRKRLRVIERAVLGNMKEESSCCGVSLSQCHILLELEEHDSTPVAELISYLGLDKSTVSRTIDGLVTLGLVLRRENPKNRRSQLLALSVQGRTIVANINELCDGKYHLLLDKLTAAERKKVLWSMDRMASLLAKETQDGKICCPTR
jgi:DNA-binding MarR family transcriptional regulator